MGIPIDSKILRLPPKSNKNLGRRDWNRISMHSALGHTCKALLILSSSLYFKTPQLSCLGNGAFINTDSVIFTILSCLTQCSWIVLIIQTCFLTLTCEMCQDPLLFKLFLAYTNLNLCLL